jgi:hypothetical protein
MLIRRTVLERVKAGETTLAFRRWRRPTVKAGGTLRTAVGVLAIEAVERTREEDISDADARRAGYAGRALLLEELARREGDLYRIQLAYAGEDPRVRLREEDALTEEDVSRLRQRLQRLDAASPTGAWTLLVLAAIEAHPRLPARELAARTGFEKHRLKPNVRKLKALGLTVSQRTGYTLSPRGRALLEQLRAQMPPPS